MPESKGRTNAEGKVSTARTSPAKAKADAKKSGAKTAKKARKQSLESPGWVAPAFVTIGLLGVLWLVLYYIASPYIPFMSALGGWNVLIGMGLMTAAFALATQWK